MWRRWGQQLAAAAVDFVYPPACLWCDGELGEGSPDRFCPGCRSNLAPVLPHRCSRCSAPVGPHLDTTAGCIHCRGDRFAFEQVISLGPYQEELRRACLRSKQNYQATLARGLAELLVDREQAQLQQWNVDIIVPVPHHWLDRLAQTHHPADSIAEQLGRCLRVPVERNVLCKRRRTKRQNGLSRTERKNNLRDAFSARWGVSLPGLRVLLTDDVLTTGTTSHRAARALTNAGAAFVAVAVLARSLAADASAANNAPGTSVLPAETR